MPKPSISKDKLLQKSSIDSVLVELMPFPVLIVDTKGKILYLNKKSVRIFGGDIVGKPCWKTLCDQKEIHSRTINEKQLLPRETHSYELGYTIKGSHMKVTDIGIILDDKPSILRILEDITEKKLSEKKVDEMNTRLRTILDSLDSGIIITDKDNKVIYTNIAFCKMCGIPSPEVIIGSDCGQNLEKCKQIFPEPFICLTKKGSKGSCSNIVREEFKLGNSYFERVHSQIHFNGKFIGNFWYHEDITEEKKSELKLKQNSLKLKEAHKELIAAHKELQKEKKNIEKKVEERTRNLKKANEKINSLLEQKKSFINQIGHDLITPLTPIIGSLQLLSLKIKDDKKKHLLDNALKNSLYLTKLLKDILSLSRLDSEMYKLNIETANLSEIVKNVLEDHKIDLKEMGVRVKKKISKTPDLELDVIKIKEVLGNIISNAYKFFSPKRKPVLEFTVMQKGNEVIVSVKDNGIGMTKNTLSKVFIEFYKADESRHDMSTGLGLAICKKIITLHGGRIWAESEGLDKGSKISFSLPIKKGGK